MLLQLAVREMLQILSWSFPMPFVNLSITTKKGADYINGHQVVGKCHCLLNQILLQAGCEEISCREMTEQETICVRFGQKNEHDVLS